MPITSDLFDNFEKPFYGYGQWWGSDIWSGTSTLTPSWSTDYAVSGVRSWKALISITPSATWGPWLGNMGSSISGGADMFFPGATKLVVMLKTPAAMSFTMWIVEGTTNGGNGDSWGAPVNIAGAPGWQAITIPSSSFVPDTGVTAPFVPSIQSIWFDWSTTPMVAIPSGTALYIDDIRFN